MQPQLCTARTLLPPQPYSLSNSNTGCPMMGDLTGRLHSQQESQKLEYCPLQKQKSQCVRIEFCFRTSELFGTAIQHWHWRKVLMRTIIENCDNIYRYTAISKLEEYLGMLPIRPCIRPKRKILYSKESVSVAGR